MKSYQIKVSFGERPFYYSQRIGKRGSNIGKPLVSAWYKVVNKIVELGGCISMSKRELGSEYCTYSKYLSIRLPECKLEELKALDEVSDIREM